MRVLFHYCNVTFVIITITATLILRAESVLFYLFLGTFQLISALIILAAKSLKLNTFREIIIYWTAVILYFTVVLNFIDNTTLKLFIIPLFIASYHCYITYRLLNRPFLTAQWHNLALFNYEIDPKVLERYLPNGTELDFWNNKCYVSLVGFRFEDVKLRSIKIPFHINFEEVNLRFYVRRLENGEWKRGVVFIKEMVPKQSLTLVANTMYKEHYETLEMKHSITKNDTTIDFVYQWKKHKKWNMILVETEKNTVPIEADSEAEFITEHYFGYTKVNDVTTFEYEVKHPRWDQYKVTNYRVDVDFEATYGSEFGFLTHQEPVSVLLAKGSEVSVENKKKIV